MVSVESFFLKFSRPDFPLALVIYHLKIFITRCKPHTSVVFKACLTFGLLEGSARERITF